MTSELPALKCLGSRCLVGIHRHRLGHHGVVAVTVVEQQYPESRPALADDIGDLARVDENLGGVVRAQPRDRLGWVGHGRAVDVVRTAGECNRGKTDECCLQARGCQC